MGNNGQRPPRDERPLKRQNKQAGGSSFLSDTVASRKHQLRQMAKDVGRGGPCPRGSQPVQELTQLVLRARQHSRRR